VELLIRIPPLSYVLMGGGIALLIATLVSLCSSDLFPRTGLELLEWPKLPAKMPFSWHGSFLESGYSLSHFTNLFHALFRHPALKSWRSKVTCIFNKLHSKAGF